VDYDGGNLVNEGDMRARLLRALDNFKPILWEGCFELSDVMRLNYYTTGVDRCFETHGPLVGRLAESDGSPPSTLLGVARLAYPGLLVKIEATAVA
jgi:enamine deaminase RidA (YjgF/YER057c/UK114 family)